MYMTHWGGGEVFIPRREVFIVCRAGGRFLLCRADSPRVGAPVASDVS